MVTGLQVICSLWIFTNLRMVLRCCDCLVSKPPMPSIKFSPSTFPGNRYMRISAWLHESCIPKQIQKQEQWRINIGFMLCAKAKVKVNNAKGCPISRLLTYCVREISVSMFPFPLEEVAFAINLQKLTSLEGTKSIKWEEGLLSVFVTVKLWVNFIEVWIALSCT